MFNKIHPEPFRKWSGFLCAPYPIFLKTQRKKKSKTKRKTEKEKNQKKKIKKRK